MEQLAFIPEKRVDINSLVPIHIPIDDLPSNKDLKSPNPSKEMIQSVKSLGVITAIWVQKTKKGWKVVAGRRRVKAARAAKLSRIPALVLSPEWCQGDVLALLENGQRSENPLTDIEAIEAIAARSMSAGLTEFELIESIASEFGISQAKAKKYAGILALPSKLRKAMNDGNVSISVACSLLNAPGDVVQEAVKELGEVGAAKLTSKRVAEMKQASRQKSLGKSLGLELEDQQSEVSITQLPEQFWKARALNLVDNLEQLLDDSQCQKTLAALRKNIEKILTK